MLLLDERSNRRGYIIIPHSAPAPTTRLESRGLSKGCQEKKIRNVKAPTRKSPTKLSALKNCVSATFEKPF